MSSFRKLCCCFRHLHVCKLAEGSSAIVYELFDSNGSSMGWALKAFKKAKEGECDVEWNILKDIQHDHIVKCAGKPGFVGGIRVFLLEMMEKRSLHYIYKFRPIEEFEVRYFIWQLLKAVDHLHSLNILHRDIKGANCLVGPAGILKLADFAGAVKMEGEQETTGGSHVSPDWAPPEVFQGVYGKPSDVYRLGCTWIEIFNRGQLFPQLNNQKKSPAGGRIPEIPPPPTVSLEAQELIRRCLNTDPFMRPTAAELLKDEYFEAVEEKYFQMVSKDRTSSEESGVLIFDESANQNLDFMDLNTATCESPSCCMSKVCERRNKFGGRSVAKLDTVETVFFQRQPKKPRNYKCDHGCSFLNMLLMDGDADVNDQNAHGGQILERIGAFAL